MSKVYKIISGIFLLIPVVLFAQEGTISGKVTDENGTPLAGVNILLKNTNSGTATDLKGDFNLSNIPYGNYTLIASMVGYKKFVKNIKVNKPGLNLKIVLRETTLKFNEVVVTAGKHRQKILDLPVSAEVISPYFISKKNFIKLDDVLRYAPGVNVTLDQVSIRGSSGYSRGAGTRVLVAIDGIPAFTGDTGEIIWELVPVSDLDRVEIIKGAASSLYGSSAIGGVINIITKSIPRQPVTLIKTQVGIYDKPFHKQWDWSDKYRTFNNLTVSHSNSFGNLGVAISLTRYEDMSYRLNDWQNRFSGYFKSLYKFSDSVSLSFMATGFYRDKATFDYWKSSREALVPSPNQIGNEVHSERFLFGSIYKNKISQTLSLTLKSSWYRSFWKDKSESKNFSSSNQYRVELITNYKFRNGLFIVGGSEINYGTVNSNIFGNKHSAGFAFYAQAEYNFNNRLKFSGGARFDYNKLHNLNPEYSFSPKIGFNYKLNKQTVFRGNITKGFRAPTLAETFTSTITSGIKVKPNPTLNSETNYNFEIGINKQLTGNINLDFAVFNNEFYDMIEPAIDITDGEVTFNNVTRARITGAEFTGKFKIPSIDFSTGINYTLLLTKDLNKNKTLKYRPKHSFNIQTDFTPGNFSIGADFRYWSRVEEIDIELVDLGLVPNGDERVPVYVLDFRTGYNFFSLGFPANLFLTVNNVLNYNYVEMIGNISPIRNISLNLELIF